MSRLTLAAFAVLAFAACETPAPAPAAPSRDAAPTDAAPSGPSGALTVADAYAPAAPAAGTSALFFSIAAGSEPDTLVAVAFAGAERTEVHETYDTPGGLRGMRTVPGGVPVAAGATVALAPGSYHAMLLGLAAPLAPGDTLDAVATFARAGEVPLRAVVRTLGEMPAP